MPATVEQLQPLHITAIAGGGGGPVMAQGLRAIFPDAQIDMVAPMHDDGGATHRIRQAYAEVYGGIGAPGDVTAIHCGASQRPDIRAIVDGERFGEGATVRNVRDRARALLGVMAVTGAEGGVSSGVDPTRAVRVLARMGRVACRLDSAGTLKGQTVRNMLLTALWLEHEGDMVAAVREFGRWVDSSVNVIPVSGGSTHLALQRSGTEFARGEGVIDDMLVEDPLAVDIVVDHGPNTGRAQLTPEAQTALSTADVVIAGPGSLITSVGGALAVGGMPEALAAQGRAGGAFVGVANLYVEQKPGGEEAVTTLNEYTEFLGRLAGRDLDLLIYNTDHRGLPPDVTPLRFREGSLTPQGVRAIGCSLVAAGAVQPQANDVVRRTKAHTNAQAAALVIKQAVLQTAA